MKGIYLDHAASAPLLPEVAEAMLDVMRGGPGNPSSLHAFGRAARARLTDARDRIAARLNCKPSEIVFTSGGTESDNAAVIGASRALGRRGKTHIVVSAIEHHAVLHAADALEREGFAVTRVLPDSTGYIDPAAVEEALRPETGLVSVMWANNEVGTIQPIHQIGGRLKERGIVFHVDAVQALGVLPIDLKETPAHLVSFSAHKLGGPQGIGALYIAAGTPFESLIHGGSQERKRRAGTENVAAAWGFARAVELAVERMDQKVRRLAALRDRLEALLIGKLGPAGAIVNGRIGSRLPHVTNISFIGADTETLLMALDLEGIAAASGSACSSGSLERSHVLKAMGLPEERLKSAVRFSFGPSNTMEEIETAAEKIATIADRLRNK
ncbi:MAG: cysteine desulfurase [Thermobacillus sp.]|uniref:Cysteine desulfurase family protein n=1 Tax=Thermobacillus composti (strain DSM 18247 / JCM 13945 / KWC4) TaxID=717605 RepID=L0EFL1_THECK|nr:MULTISPECIES: cysteine desulfurase family protein [Thermobacillus]AGA58597.1 cysteine desulfurase family protein [Thermobacillus composti KWC4]REK52574.1 MAG: cysteine desulfurase [Thermobacillus sp.]